MPVIKLLFLTIVLPGDFVVARLDAKLRWRFWSHALIYPFGIFKSWQVCPRAVELVLEWTGLPGGEVQSVLWSDGLDTALYKTTPLPFYTHL